MSLICIVVIIILVINEFLIWWNVETVSQLSVDDSPDEQIQINFDIVFPNIECRFIGVNIADKSGKILYNIWHNIHKHDIDLEGKEYSHTKLKEFTVIEDHLRIDKHAKEKADVKSSQDNLCLPCYEAVVREGSCCNTCNELIQAFQKTGIDFSYAMRYPQCNNMNSSMLYVAKGRGGCNVHGVVNTNRVEGRLRIGLATPFRVLQASHSEVVKFLEENLDLSHTIRRMSFGTEVKGISGPLNGFSINQTLPCIFNYFAQIVPTTYKYFFSSKQTNQYSATYYQKEYNLEFGIIPSLYACYNGRNS